MDIIEKLKDQGWYLTEEAIKKLPDDVDKSDTKKIIQTVMDMDLRGIAEGALPSEISRKNDSILGHRVLQITKIRNLSAPKANEESKVAPRFLQIELTDGVNQIFALEIDNISSISLNTPPGTKLYLRSDRIPLMQGQLVLRSNDIQILGGKVQNLIEKWEMTRTLQKYSKSGNRMMIMSGSSGPPPWIAFGQKIQQNIAGNNDKNFKSLTGTGDKENKEKNEFDTMRSEAIAEAAKAGSKKIFGGGNQQLLDHNLKKIMEKGFTEEEARNALKANRNILEQALYNLKRRDEFKNKDMSGGKRGGFKDTKKSKSDEPVIATKPAANVSLFDFLTDKLPTNPETSDKNVSNKSDRPKSYNHDNSKPPPYHSQQSYNHQHQTSNTHYQSAVSNHQQQSHHQQQKRDQHSQQQQSQSQYHQMQQQNHGNYNHANRQKFENNLSSSFATRNTNSSDQQQQQQPHDNYKNRDKNPQENVQNTNAYSSSRQKDSSEKYKNNQRNSNYGQNQRPNERYSGSGYQKSGAGQQQTQQQSQHQSQSQHQHQLQPQHQQQSQQSQHQHQPQQQYPQDHQPQQQQQTHTQYQVKTTSSSGSYDSRNRNEYQKRNGYDTGKASSNSSRYHSKDSNSHQPTVRNYNENRQQQSNTNDSGKINKLIEETSKMKIESSSTTSRIHQQQQQPPQQQQQQQPQPQHQNSRIQSNVVVTSHHQIKPYQQHHQQQPPSQQLAPHLQQRPPSHSQHQQMQPPPQSQQPQHSIPPHTTYTQLPNGFTYDPSKIMGFQSKEANEFAMTLLKTQAAAAGAAIPPIQVAPHAAYPPPIQIPPTAFPTPQFVMPPTAAAPPQMTGPYGMTQCGGENWNWKIGDRCLAKYWDDGRYYEAEVTGVSDKTCVVLYLGYGNHEEVLKCDCLPLTDAQHRPINMAKLHETHQPPPPTAAALANAAAVAAVAPPTVAPQAVITATTIPTPLQPPLPPPASISQQHALNRGMHAASRYRGERQMYVPPPKRDG